MRNILCSVLMGFNFDYVHQDLGLKNTHFIDLN